MCAVCVGRGLVLFVVLPGLLVDESGGVVVDLCESGGFGTAVGKGFGAGELGDTVGRAGDVIVRGLGEVDGLFPVSVDGEVL